jgi:NADH-quinone oxidoreductase subunit J
MSFLEIVFYAFSASAILSGVMVIASKNPVHGALFLVMSFVSMSGLWMMLNAEFLALILVLVYVGAVMTLFLFVVMMLRVNVVSLREGFVHYFILGMLVVLMIIGMIYMVVGPDRYGIAHMPVPAVPAEDYSNIADLGSVIYTKYAYPFEIAAVLLLTGIVAAITLTHGKGKQKKSQNIEKQIAVKRDQRVRLVDLPRKEEGSI